MSSSNQLLLLALVRFYKQKNYFKESKENYVNRTVCGHPVVAINETEPEAGDGGLLKNGSSITPRRRFR